MSTISIYEPALCCETGVCDFCVYTEPIRITRIAENLKKSGIILNRYDLKNSPKDFTDNAIINKMIQVEGEEILPVTFVDGKIVKTKEYPLGDEIMMWLNIPVEYIRD